MVERNVERNREFWPSTKRKNTLDYIQEYPHRTKKILGITNHQFQDLVEVGEKGPGNDISLFREQQKKFDNNQMFGGDKVYQGGKNISPTYKKPRKGESTSE